MRRGVRPWPSRPPSACRLRPVSDAFVPEADKLDQGREVSASSDPEDQAAALAYPERWPTDASEADVLEQMQSVEDDDDWRD